MPERKKSNLIVLTDFSQHGMAAVRTAASLARFFQTSLTIVSHFSVGRHTVKCTPTASLQEILPTEFSNLEIIDNKEFENISSLHQWADSTNSIMYVLAVGRKRGTTFFSPKRALQFIRTSRLPVMTVGENGAPDAAWRNVLLTIDPVRQAKEKALWAGYFNRFGKSTVRVLHNSYRDSLMKEKLEDGIEFIEKLYKNLEINTFIIEEMANADDLDAAAIHRSADYNAAVLVAMTTKHKTWVDILFGTREQQWLANAEGLPVLCINERDDLYVLCT